jgi:hypothetical protein
MRNWLNWVRGTQATEMAPVASTATVAVARPRPRPVHAPRAQATPSQALVCRWLGRPLPKLARIDDQELEMTLAHVEPRVLVPPESATA